MENINGVRVIENRFINEKAWHNTRTNKRIKPKYLSRTKYKELRPNFIMVMGDLHTHPNNTNLLNKAND